MNPSWGKGYARKGAALHGARRYDEAIAAYETGLKFEDSPALKKGLKEVQDAQRASVSGSAIKSLSDVLITVSEDSAGDGMGLGKMFSDPNLLGKLASNPRTAKHLADPAFVQKVPSGTCSSLPVY